MGIIVRRLVVPLTENDGNAECSISQFMIDKEPFRVAQRFTLSPWPNAEPRIVLDVEPPDISSDSLSGLIKIQLRHFQDFVEGMMPQIKDVLARYAIILEDYKVKKVTTYSGVTTTWLMINCFDMDPSNWQDAVDEIQLLLEHGTTEEMYVAVEIRNERVMHNDSHIILTDSNIFVLPNGLPDRARSVESTYMCSGDPTYHNHMPWAAFDDRDLGSLKVKSTFTLIGSVLSDVIAEQRYPEHWGLVPHFKLCLSQAKIQKPTLFLCIHDEKEIYDWESVELAIMKGLIAKVDLPAWVRIHLEIVPMSFFVRAPSPPDIEEQSEDMEAEMDEGEGEGEEVEQEQEQEFISAFLQFQRSFEHGGIKPEDEGEQIMLSSIPRFEQYFENQEIKAEEEQEEEEIIPSSPPEIQRLENQEFEASEEEDSDENEGENERDCLSLPPLPLPDQRQNVCSKRKHSKTASPTSDTLEKILPRKLGGLWQKRKR